MLTKKISKNIAETTLKKVTINFLSFCFNFQKACLIIRKAHLIIISICSGYLVIISTKVPIKHPKLSKIFHNFKNECFNYFESIRPHYWTTYSLLMKLGTYSDSEKSKILYIIITENFM